MTGGRKMQNHWTKDDVAAACVLERTYAHDPVAYRFLCGHCIQDETEEDALTISVAFGLSVIENIDLVNRETYDLAWILELCRRIT